MFELKNVQHGFDLEVGDIGVTVRKGVLWAKRARLRDFVQLWECPEPHGESCAVLRGTGKQCVLHGAGQMLGCWIGLLDALPPQLLALEHEIESRTMMGLMSSLERAYGKATVDDDKQEWTALIYVRTA